MKIIFSLDREWFYIRRDGYHPNYWMGSERKALPPTESLANSPMEGGLSLDGIYYRRTRSFVFWEMRTCDEEDIGIDSELFKDFCAMERWSLDTSGDAIRAIREQLGMIERRHEEQGKAIERIRVLAGDGKPCS